MSTGGEKVTPDEFLQRVLDAAQSHGAESEPDHEVGDLQMLVAVLWERLPKTARTSVMAHPALNNLIKDWWIP